LGQLADQVRLSPRYLSTLFKHSVGIRPHRYVLRDEVQPGVVHQWFARDRLATRDYLRFSERRTESIYSHNASLAEQSRLQKEER
jgi:hypothetical protein